jgi:hypothetical protein
MRTKREQACQATFRLGWRAVALCCLLGSRARQRAGVTQSHVLSDRIQAEPVRPRRNAHLDEYSRKIGGILQRHDHRSALCDHIGQVTHTFAPVGKAQPKPSPLKPAHPHNLDQGKLIRLHRDQLFARAACRQMRRIVIVVEHLDGDAIEPGAMVGIADRISCPGSSAASGSGSDA